MVGVDVADGSGVSISSAEVAVTGGSVGAISNVALSVGVSLGADAGSGSGHAPMHAVLTDTLSMSRLNEDRGLASPRRIAAIWPTDAVNVVVPENLPSIHHSTTP